MGKEKTFFRCERCGGVSDKEKGICKPVKVKKSDLSKAERKKEPRHGSGKKKNK